MIFAVILFLNVLYDAIVFKVLLGGTMTSLQDILGLSKIMLICIACGVVMGWMGATLYLQKPQNQLLLDKFYELPSKQQSIIKGYIFSYGIK